MTLFESLRNLSFFNNLDEKNLELLSSFSFVSKYKKESILFYETDLNNNIIFLVSGMIKVYKYDKFDNEIFLYHIYEDSLVSELSSISNTEINCFSNASFVEDSIVLFINFKKLKEHFFDKNLLVNELVDALFKKKS